MMSTSNGRATSLTKKRRASDLERLSSPAAGTRAVDLLIIGGGITGTGTALDAASRGLSVVLVEAHDLAFGTSRWSSKLVHGGLRYLATGNIGIAHRSAVDGPAAFAPGRCEDRGAALSHRPPGRPRRRIPRLRGRPGGRWERAAPRSSHRPGANAAGPWTALPHWHARRLRRGNPHVPVHAAGWSSTAATAPAGGVRA